jgi:beta-alanine degradation protein BauB
MALTMMDKQADRSQHTPWPQWLSEEFAQERNHPNGCVGSELLSESERVRVWTIRLKPGERLGFHRHVLDYFWSALTPGRGRQHLADGSTVDHSYAAGETRHETYASGEFKVHDLENIGESDLLFTTVEFLDSANAPLRIAHASRGA